MRWYTYDDCGNILSKKVYAHTSPDVTPTGSCTEYAYEYEGGRLRSFNGEFVDCINLEPETYRDNELTWSRGRNLVSYCCNRFAYDGNGLRVAKNDIKYTYIGDRLAQEIRKDTSGNAQHTYIDYLYDDTGIAGFVYNDTRLPDGKKTYFYVKNIFGDVIAICENSADSCGVVAKYAYDAWGKCSVSYDNGSGISAINPIRYRGYYYDIETGLYYLQSRYYDPEVGRFINADIAEYVDPENFGGTNLYAYCLNNPVMCSDGSGHSPEWWQWALSGLSLAAGIACCIFVPGGQVFGVGLIVNGASGLISNTMDVMGIDGKTASIISAGLSIVAGIALCCITIGGIAAFAGIGAGLIGQGVGSISGGYISEALGGSFELGAALGGITGSVAGGFAYRGIMSYKFSHMTAYQKGAYAEKYVKAIYGNKVYKPTTGANRPDLLFYNGSTLIEVKNVASQSLTSQLNRYLNLGYGTNIVYVRVGTRVSSALKASSYVIKYLPW